jgi:hypothetical protein
MKIRYRRFLQTLWLAYTATKHVHRLLASPITVEGALAAVQRRVADREKAFLYTVEHAVFAHRASPYRPLLEAAGYDLDALKTLVGTVGIEGALRALRDRGVYVSVQEYKGIHEARRGHKTFRFSPQAFNNPLVRSGLSALSGGTRSWGIPTTISLSNHRMGAEHLTLALAAYGLRARPVVVWIFQAHGASLWAVLSLAASGMTPPKWFTLLPSDAARTGQMRSLYIWIRQIARLTGVRLPVLTSVPIGQETTILRWRATDGDGGSCGILTTPSQALRLALQAKRDGVRLDGVTFITIAEPLTPAKLAGIREAGGRAFSSLGFTEFGRITYGCAAPDGPDDTHICRDAVAVIRRRRSVDAIGTEVDALLFTTLLPDARKILMNMESGDYATMTDRRCGCPLDSAGWTEHLVNIRSFEKLNAEGRLFFGSELIALLEEVLPSRFGGTPTDYQLVEHEDAEGFTRLSLFAHPRLGALDEAALVATVDEALRNKHVANTWVLREAGALRVHRAAPLLTQAGKLMSLHHLGALDDVRRG